MGSLQPKKIIHRKEEEEEILLYFSVHLRQIPLTNLLSLSSSAEKIHYQFLFNVKAFLV